MKVFITGATGFIGQHLLNELKEKGHALTILSSKTNPSFWSGCNVERIVVGNLANIQNWKETLIAQDAVIHLASELKDEAKMEEVNSLGASQLAKASLEAGVPVFIHLSSVGVVGKQYSGQQIHIAEDAVCSPQNKYETTKWEGEVGVSKLLKDKSRLVILRPTNVYGDHNDRNVLLALIRKIKKGSWIPFAGSAFVNYLYVADLAKVIEKALSDSKLSGVYTIGAPAPPEVFFQVIADELKVDLRTMRVPAVFLRTLSFLLSGDEKGRVTSLCNRIVYDDSKWRQLNGSNYLNVNKDGIRKMIDWYKSNQLI